MNRHLEDIPLNVSVIGAGTMGHGLALLFALGGDNVVLVDVDRERLDFAMQLVRSHMADLNLCELFMVDPGAVIERIRTEINLSAGVSGSDLVIEAIVEKSEAKKDLFHSLARLTGKDAVIASNTSYMNVFTLAPDELQERLLIAHFYNPPYIVPLVEIVPGPRTFPDAMVWVKEHLARLHLTCITMKRYIPGFIVNRLQRALNRELFHLLEQEIADPEEIDRAVKASLGIRIPVTGLVSRLDFTGLDAVLNNIKGEPVHLASGSDLSPIIERLVSEGRFGVKTGRGFFDYNSRDCKEILRERDLRLIEIRKMMESWNRPKDIS
jgi:3-hydroxybutyryl-CoA dehydrogenase